MTEMTRGQHMLAEHNMIRVGVRPECEVYVKPDGDVQPAMMAVIWEANRICNERGIPALFGEPKLSGDEYRDIEEYEHTRVVHVKDKRDGTVRIVAKDDLGRDVLAEVWDRLAERILLATRAKAAFPEANEDQLRFYLPDYKVTYA